MLCLGARNAVGGLLADNGQRVALPTEAEGPRAELAVEDEQHRTHQTLRFPVLGLIHQLSALHQLLMGDAGAGQLAAIQQRAAIGIALALTGDVQGAAIAQREGVVRQ